MIKPTLALIVAVVVLAKIVSTSAENILFLQTLSSKSHHIWNKQIIDRLYDNGHNLTILSFFEEKSIPGKTFLVAADFMGKIMAEYSDWDYTAEVDPFINIKQMYDYYSLASRIISEENAFLELLKYPKTFRFDLIVHDFTMGQFLLGLVEYFGNPPLVSVTAFNIPSYAITLADAPLMTTYMPHYTAEFTNRMTFIERVKNTLFWAFDIFYRSQVYMRGENSLSRKIFGQETTSLNAIEKRSDLILVNCDFSMDYYQPLPPNVIPVAGLHVFRKEDISPVIKQFIARANKGVILLSFGTIFATEMLGEQVNKAIMDVFRGMSDYGFIWKHGDPASLGVMPPNVLVLPWVPQAAVLSNQRTRLLISHGGLLSLQEASWYGVPVVAVPFFVDQQSNADKLERTGVGAKLLPKDINEENLRKSILKVVENESYRTNMKLRSQRFRSQPEHPLDRAIFWIEKVIENKGLGYLRSPGHDMSLVVLYGLDMIGVVLLVLLLVYSLLRKCAAKVSGQKSTKPSKSKKE
ncbi:UDP-glycosyltransferase UGT5-like isoform X1 [Uranotaenia lowii]|uniref:UDP-glycosyltransferase UGT5-like isoform X1 n=1 Tax=Uranotaenia lowii TaxID=190385 RepID=UPI002479CB1C|nr:UDP-glycosyltransferase UGT5-like isoform X1 [Uranotaenia lowii]XP_055588373.1 UDP-glycosyltransferase UGT5-like isoform X1 [Uranotaenia lowii]